MTRWFTRFAPPCALQGWNIILVVGDGGNTLLELGNGLYWSSSECAHAGLWCAPACLISANMTMVCFALWLALHGAKAVH